MYKDRKLVMTDDIAWRTGVSGSLCMSSNQEIRPRVVRLVLKNTYTTNKRELTYAVRARQVRRRPVI